MERLGTTARPHPVTWWRLAVALLVGAALVLGVSCSDGGTNAGRPEGATPSPGVDRPARPAPPPGPAADLSTELTGGNGPFTAAGSPTDLAAAGYVQQEFAAAGTATSYQAAGALGADGRWEFAPGSPAPYRTRVLVRRPAKAADFSGSVVVEWLNVSGGVDADVEWGALREEIIRQGHAWVGVSAQRIGVVGGPVLVPVTEGASLAGRGLVTIDPARYGSLRHPGDGFSFDILTQVGRAVRTGVGLGGPRPRQLIAAGESQAAYALVTYYNGVQPHTRAFDGFFVHSRGASGLPLVGPEEHADLVKALGSTPTVFRTDQDAPVLDVQTESDLTGLLSSHRARQPDNARLRLWEVAGTAHVDTHLLGTAAARIDCGVPINSGPLHLVAKAGLRALAAWVTTGTPPAGAPRIEVTTDGEPSIRRDTDRIAVGGVRTPPVEIPVTVLSGEPGPTSSAICQLAGSNRPLPAGRLAERYPSRNEYQKRYNEATESAVRSGFLLSEDRPAMLAMADSSLIVA